MFGRIFSLLDYYPISNHEILAQDTLNQISKFQNTNGGYYM